MGGTFPIYIFGVKLVFRACAVDIDYKLDLDPLEVSSYSQAMFPLFMTQWGNGFKASLTA